MALNRICVKSLKITEFRIFRNIQIDFNKPITLITGRNGTAKSTLLGMLAQPFSFDSKKDCSVYIDNYHGLDLTKYVDIAGNRFTYPCDKVFRLSKAHDTPDKKYLYETELDGLNLKENPDSPLKTKRLLTVRQARSGNKLRFVTGPAIEGSESISHNSGEGNFPHPVIYLSLGRLYPLAELKNCEISEDHEKLDAKEAQWYSKAYKEIFAIVDEEPESGLMDTKEKKRSIVPLTLEYDGESCSAGQDNVGRILTALLSFRRLKEKLGKKYRGGLLLIDEVDATLHPDSQVKLIELLRREREELSLQIVVTTHSLYLIQHCSTVMRKNVGIIHISKDSGALEIESSATIEMIESNLKNEAILPQKSKKGKKVSVIVQDGEAVKLFKYIVKQNPFFKDKISISNIKGKRIDKSTHISGDYLRIIADNASKIPELKNVIFVPDGDMQWAKNSKNKNVVALPGNEPIEKQIYDMLNSLPANDVFWKNCSGKYYNKSVAIGNSVNLNASDTKSVKKWYCSQKPYWGLSLSIVFDKYFENHKSECEKFLSALREIVKRCL